MFDLAQKGANNKEIVLDKFVELFKVGAVYKHYHDNNWNYRVNGLSDTLVLINYFDSFHLQSSKHNNYLKWRKAYIIIQEKNHLTETGLDKICKLKNSMNRYSV